MSSDTEGSKSKDCHFGTFMSTEMIGNLQVKRNSKKYL